MVDSAGGSGVIDVFALVEIDPNEKLKRRTVVVKDRIKWSYIRSIEPVRIRFIRPLPQSAHTCGNAFATLVFGN